MKRDKNIEFKTELNRMKIMFYRLLSKHSERTDTDNKTRIYSLD